MKNISTLLAVLLVAGIMALGGTAMAGEADEHEAYFQDVITGATE